MMHEPPRISKVAGSFPWMASYASGQSPGVKYWQAETPGSFAAGALPLRANTEGWQRACDRDAHGRTPPVLSASAGATPSRVLHLNDLYRRGRRL